MAKAKRLVFNKYDNSFPQPFEIYVKKKFIVTDKMGNIFGLFFPLDVTMVTPAEEECLPTVHCDSKQ